MLKSSVRSDDNSCNESRSDGHKSICCVYEFYVLGCPVANDAIKQYSWK